MSEIRLPHEGEEDFGGAGTMLLCLAVTGAALWTMKKISEGVRGEKIRWKDFLFPKQ